MATEVRSEEGTRRQFLSHGPSLFDEPKPVHDALLAGFVAVFHALESYAGWLFDQTFLSRAEGGWLDEHGRERGLERLTGETEEQFRSRVRAIEEKVTPEAIVNRVNAMLAVPEATLYEHPLSFFAMDEFHPKYSMYEGRRVFDGEYGFTVSIPDQLPPGRPGMWANDRDPTVYLTAGAESDRTYVSDPESLAQDHDFEGGAIRIRPGAVDEETRTVSESRRTWLLFSSLVTWPFFAGLPFRTIASGTLVAGGRAGAASDVNKVVDPSKNYGVGALIGQFVTLRPGQPSEETRQIIGNSATEIYVALTTGEPFVQSAGLNEPYIVTSSDPSGVGGGGIIGSGTSGHHFEAQAGFPNDFSEDSENGRDLLVFHATGEPGVWPVTDTVETMLWVPDHPFETAPEDGAFYLVADTEEQLGEPTLRSWILDDPAIGPSGKELSSWAQGVGPAHSAIYGSLHRMIQRIKAAGVPFQILVE